MPRIFVKSDMKTLHIKFSGCIMGLYKVRTFMSVLADIRAVPRPVNTVVDGSSHDGSKPYVVRQRTATKYIAGDNPQLHNGKVVGHIIDYRFVPGNDAPEPAAASPDMFSYGSSALVRSVIEDIRDDLLDVYDPSDAFAIMAIATLKV